LPLQIGSTCAKNRHERQRHQSWDDQRVKRRRGRHNGLVGVSTARSMGISKRIARIGWVTLPHL
ncbi:hypothetical protein T07_15089, partial [Trichinella nelsoni]